jgi:S-adenosylmethionine decarboxylase
MSVSRKAFAQSVLAAQQALSPRLNLHRMSWFSPTLHGRASSIPTPASINIQEQDKILGRHWMADFEISDAVKQAILAAQSPKQRIADIIHAAATVAKATILDQVSCQQNLSGDIVGNIASVVIIQESHLSMHFIPDANFIAVDVFTCGEIQFQKAIDYISLQLGCQPNSYCEVQRGIMVQDGFVAGIACREDNSLQMLKSSRNVWEIPSIGRHVIIELYLCDKLMVDDVERTPIDDADWIPRAFRNAILIAGGRLQDDFVYKFSPQGVSQVSIASGIEEQTGGHCHLTIHTYPEFNYAAVDVFDATGQLNMDRMIHCLQTSLKSARISTHEFLRGAYAMNKDNQRVFIDGLQGVPAETAPEVKVPRMRRNS